MNCGLSLPMKNERKLQTHLPPYNERSLLLMRQARSTSLLLDTEPKPVFTPKGIRFRLQGTVKERLP